VRERVGHFAAVPTTFPTTSCTPASREDLASLVRPEVAARVPEEFRRLYRERFGRRGDRLRHDRGATR
jgi:hypothetical protein